MKIGNKKGVAPFIILLVLVVAVGAIWYGASSDNSDAGEGELGSLFGGGDDDGYDLGAGGIGGFGDGLPDYGGDGFDDPVAGDDEVAVAENLGFCGALKPEGSYGPATGLCNYHIYSGNAYYQFSCELADGFGQEIPPLMPLIPYLPEAFSSEKFLVGWPPGYDGGDSYKGAVANPDGYKGKGKVYGCVCEFGGDSCESQGLVSPPVDRSDGYDPTKCSDPNPPEQCKDKTSCDKMYRPVTDSLPMIVNEENIDRNGDGKVDFLDCRRQASAQCDDICNSAEPPEGSHQGKDEDGNYIPLDGSEKISCCKNKAVAV